ncbi:hypothetical protein K488DRAFT_34584, partial [Vararia minispora EC-137]
YKPVDCKIRPVPTYFPDPHAQQFKPIPLPKIECLVIPPEPHESFTGTVRLTRERLDQLLAAIPDGFLRPQEVDLVASVVIRHEKALAWEFSEKGYFSREYYPDYKIATVEHIPWQNRPIHVPSALESVVCRELSDQRDHGRFE